MPSFSNQFAWLVSSFHKIILVIYLIATDVQLKLLNSKSQKILIAVIYLICLVLILYGFFNFVDLSQISNYSYIQEKTQISIKYKSENLLYLL